MKLKQWALIAEIIGGVAIVASLIFVVIELRESTRAQNAATYQQISNTVGVLISSVPREARTKVRNGQPLSDAERGEYNAFVIMAMRAYESWWRQWRLGILTDDDFNSYITHMGITLSDDFSRLAWEQRTIQYLPGFEDFVDDFLEHRSRGD